MSFHHNDVTLKSAAVWCIETILIITRLERRCIIIKFSIGYGILLINSLPSRFMNNSIQ